MRPDGASRIRSLFAAMRGETIDALVGVVDGTPDLASPDLDGVDLALEALMLPDGAAEPDAHGTEIASLIFGRAFGLAHGARGLALPIFFRRPGDGRIGAASQMDMARALTLAAERGCDVVNVSAGQKASSPEAARHLTDAVALCAERRVLVVAAAGNDGCPCIHIPAAMPSVLAVGAMDDDGAPLEPSNWGSAYAADGLLAPGGELETVSTGGAAVRRSGTSFATAVVSAVAATLLSIARQQSYGLDAIDVGRLLVDTAAPCDPAADGDCRRILAGRLDVRAALARLHEVGAARLIHPAAAPPSAIDSFETRGIEMTEVLGRSIEIAPATAFAGAGPGEGASQQGCSCGCKSKPKDAEDEAAYRPKARQSAEPSMSQQGCGCQSKSEPQLVYAIGALWFDFGSEARYDAIVQQMNDPVAANDPTRLFAFLEENIAFAAGVTFVLLQDQIPIYAVQPSGPFAVEVYRSMIEAMVEGLAPSGEMQRVAVPGLMSGTTRLMNGMTVPVLYPDIRGMVKWKVAELVESARKAVGDNEIQPSVIFEFLTRVYDELRNLGVAPQERAMNFAATNAYQAAIAFGDAAKRKLELHRIAVRKSPICRPESDCWDVELVMFDPENERRAARFYRYTVDVSEVLPVTVGVMRAWNAPLAASL
ncbi:MAG: hypothetical protein DI565_01895 [Ancylobacter novellus]|uniref:PatA/PatG family cyanobactin maturation protease n=1 Tax=Ancylobacter novellus TaxID=921 RepID=A0A2W5KSP9_ANCNO|nr:MAG: hypothetical protein DI565_01895 [Ancylobacter novellus]